MGEGNAHSPFCLMAGGVGINVRLTPKASRNAISGIDATATGENYLKIMVTTVPEDGKANAALCKLLAKTWKLPAGRISVISGATSRHKKLLVAEGNLELKTRLDAWLKDFLAGRG